LVWQGVIWVFGIPLFILPTPAQVLTAGIDQRELLLNATATTVIEAAAGFVVGNLIGVVVALVVASWLGAARVILPLALAIRSAPIIAITPLLTLLLGYSLSTAAVIVALIVFFPTVVNGVLGLRSVSEPVLEFMHVVDASQVDVLRHVRIPAALPPLFAAFRIGAASSILGAMIAEWVTTGTGLGYVVLQSGVHFELAVLWAAILISTALSFAAVGLTDLVERIMVPWAERALQP
jgi:NitT/TauT family transport system permease protein